MKTKLTFLGVALAAALFWSGCSDDTGPVGPDSGVAFRACDLVVTEFMAAPEGDSDAEWVELYNNSGKKIDSLIGLRLKVNNRSCNLAGSLDKGGYLMVSRSGTPDGGAGAKKVVACSGIQLANDGATISVEYRGAVIHELRYGDDAKGTADGGGDLGPAKGKDGLSWQLSSHVVSALKPGSCQSTAASVNWCYGDKDYDANNKGTPGTANVRCPVPEAGIPDKGPGGDLPPPPPPLAKGALLVSEILYNPDTLTESSNEWFEIYNNSGKKIDTLRGVVVQVWSNSSGQSSAKTLTFGAGAPGIALDGFLVVRSSKWPANPMDTGAWANPSNTYVWSSMPSLVNSTGSTIRLLNSGTADGGVGSEIFKISYDGQGTSGSWPKDGEGQPIQLSQAKLDAKNPRITAADAVKPVFWCNYENISNTSMYKYDAYNVGTPGRKNLTCPEQPRAGQCKDGTTGKWRAVVAPVVGSLQVTEVLANPSSSPNDYRQWVEIQPLAAFDLNWVAVEHKNASGNTRTGTVKEVACLRVTSTTPASVKIIGSSKVRTKGATKYNGNVPVDAVVDDEEFLYASSGSSTLTIKNNKGTAVETVTLPSPPNGGSVCYDPVAKKWDDSTTTGVYDDTGTPGSLTCKHK